jgi:Na+/H+ antiporter NhaD/arsenite permease-like protein
VFVVTYVLIATQRLRSIRVSRPAAALLGAVAMVVVGGLGLEGAYRALDMDVLVFLFGLMLLVAQLERAGIFEWAARRAAAGAGTPGRLLVAVVFVSGILSSLFVNDTVCLVLTPVVLTAARRLEQPPVPYLLGLAMGANVGSALTFTGNPQNMLVGVASGIGYGAFALRMAPVVLVGLMLTAAVLWWLHRDRLGPAAPTDGKGTADREAAAAEDPGLSDPRRAGWCLGLFGAAVVAWVAGLSLPLVALAAGALSLVVAGESPGPTLARVEWSLLIFFAGLFVVTGGLEATGILEGVTRGARGVLGAGGGLREAGVVSGAMLVLSNLVSNVPAVLMWRTVVPQLPDPRFVWEVVAMSSTFAGNFLLIGSVANLIVAERAEARSVRLGYWEYARAGIPVTLLTLGWGVAWLALVR